MFRTNRETGAISRDPAAEAARTPGFPKFMEEFDDAHEISPDDRDYEAVVAERLEAFKMLPEVTRAIQDLAVSENSQFLGRTFTPEELAELGKELMRLVTKEQNFGLLKTLSDQVIRYRKLPAEIMEQKLLVASLGSRDVLEHRAMGISHKIGRKAGEVRDATGSMEGMALAKEGVSIAKDLETGAGLAEKVLLSESENILGSYEKSFGELAAIQQKLADVDKAYGLPGGKGTVPDISLLKAKFQEVGKKKKDPSEYLEAIAGFNFQTNLEGLKQGLQKACQDRVETFRKIQTKPKEALKHPKLHEAIIQLNDIKNEALAVSIDTSLGRQAEVLQNDLFQLRGVRHALGYLQGDPGNMRMRMMMEDALGGFQTSVGRQLEAKLKAGVAALAETQNRLDRSPASSEDMRFAAHFSRKGFIGRFISGDPEKKMRKTAEQATQEVQNLEQEQESILGKIDTIADAEYQLQVLEGETVVARNALKGTLEVFGAIFKKSGMAAQTEIGTLINSEKPEDIMKARALMDKLIQARQDAPELYGDLDDGPDNEIDINLGGKQNLRDVRNNFLDTLTAKVENAIRKALESLTDAQLNPESFAAKLVAFEDGLGSLANTADYKQIRFNAFKGVMTKTTIFPASKKFILGQVLREAGQRGFVNGNSIDLKGFVNAVRPKVRATA